MMECVSKDTIVSKPPRGLANDHSAQIEDFFLTLKQLQKQIYNYETRYLKTGEKGLYYI